MSCHEWEKGEIIIPANVWADTKKKICAAYNEWVAEEFAAAWAFYKRFKGKTEPNPENKSDWDYWHEGRYRFNRLFFDRKADDSEILVVRTTPRRPYRSDYPFSNTQTTDFKVYAQDFSFGFDHEKKAVYWVVNDNNRACDRARNHPLGNKILSILESIEYTQWTGGDIVGNDEYSQGEGAGDYIRQKFGPKQRPMIQRLANL